MNIAFLHTSSFPYGGAEKVTSYTGAYLAKNGHNVFVFTDLIRDELLSEDDCKYLHVIKIDGVPRKRSFSEHLITAIDRHGIDIIVMQGSPYWKEIGWLRLHSKAKIVYFNHSQPLWEVVMRKEFATLKASKAAPPIQLYERVKHAIFQDWLHIDRKKFKKRYKRIYDNTDRYLSLCEGFRNEMTDLLGVNPNNNRISVITNSIPDRTGYEMNKKKQLLYVGRLTLECKAVGRLLSIWRSIYRDFPDWELLLVGDGYDRTHLEDMAREWELERIHFCGHSIHPEQYYNDAAIFCLTSTFEGWPLVLCEAQQAGVVPIAFACSAGVECVLGPDAVNGILVQPFDMDEYARRLAELMRDEEMRKKIQKNVLEKAAEYKMEHVGPQWEAVLEALK